MRIARLGRYGAFANSRGRDKLLPSEESRTAAQRILFWGLVVLVCVGVVVRLLRYVRVRSLWLDEIFLANNLIHKTPLQLLGPLDYRQGAPPVFLLLCKLAVEVLGTSEYALRFVPMVAGLGSVVFFALLAKRVLQPIGALGAMALFALLEPLVYYSSEVKQYSMDVLVAVAILWAAARLVDEATERGRGRSKIIFFAIGMAGIFASHPAVFVLAGASAWLIFSRKFSVRKLAAIFVAWVAAIILDYWFFLRPLARNAGLQHHWSAAYPPFSMQFFPWFWHAMLGLFAGYDTMWLRFTVFGTWPAYVAMILAVAGCWRLHRQKKLGLVAWPIALTLLAAMLQKYPFDDRLILFLVPMVVLMMAASLDGIAGGLATLLFGFVLISCLGRQFAFAIQPPGREEVVPVMTYLKDHWQSGDTLYLYRPADTAFLYYRDQEGLVGVPFIDGTWSSGDRDAFAADWGAIVGKRRVWVLFSHALLTSSGDEREELLQLLAQKRAKKLGEFDAPGVGVYLFDTR
ncbi:MAG TPA: glycosyltransferase family 39 protein [Tepidisphaeraceae bacterium]